MNAGIFGFPKKQTVNLPQIIEFEQSGSFTVPANAKRVSIGLVGGGGGGGGGFIYAGATSIAVDGGQGGYGGASVYQEFDALPLLNRTLVVSIGAGGAGGAGQAWNSGLITGNPGSAGADSTIRVQGMERFRMTAKGGSGGIGGGTATVAAPGVQYTFQSWNGIWGGSQATTPTRASAGASDVEWNSAGWGSVGAAGGAIAVTTGAAGRGQSVYLNRTVGTNSANNWPNAFDLPPVAITAGNVFGNLSSAISVMFLSRSGAAGSASVAGGDGLGYAPPVGWQPMLRSTMFGGVGGAGGGAALNGSTSGSGGPGWHGGGGGGAGAMNRLAANNSGFAGTGGRGGDGYAMVIIE